MAIGARRRVYGIGAAKTGTHSLGAIFDDRVHSAHEVDAEDLIRRHLERERTGRSWRLRAALRWRDRKRRLDLDASQVNIYLIPDLLRIWPDSRFVLTYRPPLAWLRSMIDDTLRRTTSDTWHRFRDYRFGTPGSGPVQEAALAEKGLYSLEGYLGYWTDSIRRATEQVPPEQCLMVRTEEIAPRAAEIAAFCGFPAGEVRAEKAHVFANDQRFSMLSKVPEDHLIRVVEETCGDTFGRLFPERSIAADVAEIRGMDTPEHPPA